MMLVDIPSEKKVISIQLQKSDIKLWPLTFVEKYDILFDKHRANAWQHEAHTCLSFCYKSPNVYGCNHLFACLWKMVSKKTNCQPAVKASYISSFAYAFAVLVAKRGGREKKETQGAIIKNTKKTKRLWSRKNRLCSLLNILLNSNTNSNKTW